LQYIISYFSSCGLGYDVTTDYTITKSFFTILLFMLAEPKLKVENRSLR